MSTDLRRRLQSFRADEADEPPAKRRRTASPAPEPPPPVGSPSKVIFSFDARLPPDERAHTLILGTMASVESLARQQTYGHPHNAFWHIVGRVLGFERAMTPYETQVQALTGHGYALWDVLHSCERKGSLDGNIRNERPNAIAELLARCPSISRICLNGQGAAGFFRKHFVALLREHRWVLANDTARRVFGGRARTEAAAGHPGERTLQLLVLPSTSPAHATLRFDAKLAAWRADCFRL